MHFSAWKRISIKRKDQCQALPTDKVWKNWPVPLMAALLLLYNNRSLFSFCKCLLGGNNVHKLNYKSVHLGRPKRWNNARRTIDNHPKIHHSTKLGDPKIWCGAKSRGESHSLHIPSGHVQWTIHTRAFFVCEHYIPALYIPFKKVTSVVSSVRFFIDAVPFICRSLFFRCRKHERRRREAKRRTGRRRWR